MEPEELNRAELLLRQHAAVLSKEASEFALNKRTYDIVKSALDENSQWRSPSGKTYVVGYYDPKYAGERLAR